MANNYGKGTCVGMIKLKIVKSELAKMQCLLKPKRNGFWRGSNVLSKLCVDQATKNGSVNCSAESLGGHWHEEMINK